MTELERLKQEVELLEPMVRLIDKGTASAAEERHLARRVLQELRRLRDGGEPKRVVRHV